MLGSAVSHGLRSWVGGCLAARIRGPPVISDHERQGLRGCRALGFVMVSDHERKDSGRVSHGFRWSLIMREWCDVAWSPIMSDRG